MQTELLQPMFVVGLLTLAVAIAMYFTRVGTMKKLRIHPQKGQDTQFLKTLLPPEVNRVSNNYNHLFEQPTLFYALCLAITFMGQVDVIHIASAWSYAILRILHSLVQTTVDKVMIRFSIFIASWLVLAVMLIRGSLQVFGF